MILIVFCFGFTSSVHWLPFNTEKKLLAACNLCEFEVSKLRKNISLFAKPEENSGCANKTDKNPFCTLVEEIKQDIYVRSQPQSNNNTTINTTSNTTNTTTNNNTNISAKYCQIHGPCKFNHTRNLFGPFCSNCLSIVSYSFAAKSNERLSTLHNFCSTAFSSTISFCEALEYMVGKNMKSEFVESRNATQFCISSAFCYEEKPKRIRRKKDNNQQQSSQKAPHSQKGQIHHKLQRGRKEETNQVKKGRQQSHEKEL